MLGKMIFDFLSKASMNEVWSMINSLQLVVYTPLVPVNFPANAVSVFNQMVNIATFDIIPKDDWYPVAFSLPIDEPLNERFMDLGLGSKFFIMNFGTLFVALVFLQGQCWTYLIVKHCCDDKKSTCCRKFEKHLGDDLFWNSFIRFLYASFIEIVFGVAINVFEFQWVSWGCYYSNAHFYFFAPIVLFTPAVFGFYIWFRYDELHFPHYRRVIGTAYDDIIMIEN